MKQKYYLILGIVIILIILGIIIVINLPSNLQEDRGTKSAIFDTAIIEATVLSITKHDDQRPDDSGQIRIDSISNYVRNPEANYEPLSKSVVGTEIPILFGYSARPAKVRCEQIPVGTPYLGEPITQPEETAPPAVQPEGLYENKSIPFEGGYYIYTYYTGTCPEETVLQGVSEGDKIRFTISYAGPRIFLYVGKYEIEIPISNFTYPPQILNEVRT